MLYFYLLMYNLLNASVPSVRKQGSLGKILAQGPCWSRGDEWTACLLPWGAHPAGVSPQSGAGALRQETGSWRGSPDKTKACVVSLGARV